MTNRIMRPTPQQIDRARELRQGTNAEAVLWFRIRDRQLGAKFRRQHPIGPFYLDCYCHELKLAIEIDGDQHYETEESTQRDASRTRYLNAQGIRVLRFGWYDVVHNTDGVLAALQEELASGGMSEEPTLT